MRPSSRPFLGLLFACALAHSFIVPSVKANRQALRVRSGTHATVTPQHLMTPGRLALRTSMDFKGDQRSGAARTRVQPTYMMLRGGGSLLAAIIAAAEAVPAGVILAVTIFLEVFATVCMKMASSGSAWWYAGVGAGYTMCFSLFPLALKRMPLSIAYATWSGAGTAASVLIGRALFGEQLTWMKVVWIALIIAGVVGLNA